MLGAGYGFSRIGSAALESMARQPEVANRVGTNMIVIAALLEGATFFALLVCLLVTLLRNGCRKRSALVCVAGRCRESRERGIVMARGVCDWRTGALRFSSRFLLPASAAAEPVKVDEAEAKAAAQKAIQEGDFEKAEKNLEELLRTTREKEKGGPPPG